MKKIFQFLLGLIILVVVGLVANYQFNGNSIEIEKANSIASSHGVSDVRNQLKSIPVSFSLHPHRLTKRMMERFGTLKEIREPEFSTVKSTRQSTTAREPSAIPKDILQGIINVSQQHTIKKIPQFKPTHGKKVQNENTTTEISSSTLAPLQITTEDSAKTTDQPVVTQNNAQMQCLVWSKEKGSMDEFEALNQAKVSIETKIKELERENDMETATALESLGNKWRGKINFLLI